MARKPPNRVNRAQFQVRMREELAEAFDAMLTAIGASVQNAKRKPMTRTDLVSYWIEWLLKQSPERREEWARTYRKAYLDDLVDDPPPSVPARGPEPSVRRQVGIVERPSRDDEPAITLAPRPLRTKK